MNDNTATDNNNLPATQADVMPATNESLMLQVPKPEIFIAQQMKTPSKEEIENAEPSGINVCFEYHEFKPNDSKTDAFGQFQGLTAYKCVNKQTGEEETLLGAVWTDFDGNVKINCATKFVSGISVFPKYTNFVAKCKGTKTTKNGGNMQLFNVQELIPTTTPTNKKSK